jgi:hypothetical protein
MLIASSRTSTEGDHDSYDAKVGQNTETQSPANELTHPAISQDWIRLRAIVGPSMVVRDGHSPKSSRAL